jgi:hypothetical protein
MSRRSGYSEFQDAVTEVDIRTRRVKFNDLMPLDRLKSLCQLSHPCHNQCDSIHSDDEQTYSLYTCIYIYIKINEVRPTQSVNQRVRVTK